MDDSINNGLSPEAATREIRGIAKFGSVTPTNHILYDHPERNYDMQDVEEVLLNGQVREPPEWDEEYENWRYKVRGHATNGKATTVVVVMLDHREILGITIMPK